MLSKEKADNVVAIQKEMGSGSLLRAGNLGESIEIINRAKELVENFVLTG